MGKFLIILLVFISGLSWGQVPVFNQFSLSENLHDVDILTYYPSKQIKITFKTMINDEVVDNIFDDLSDDIDMGEGDYLGIGKYDIRLKYYVNTRLRLLTRVVVRRLEIGSCSYYIGMEYKF